MLGVFFVTQIGVTGCKKEASDQKENTSPDSVLRRVASAYYGQVKKADARQQELDARTTRSMWAKSMPTPPSADGHVFDRKGVPIVGADVVVEGETTDDLLGQGTTDEKGYFKISLKHVSYRGLDLIIMKNGYTRWARGGIYGGIVDYQVLLDREIDKSYLNSIVAQKSPEERLWQLLEIIGPRQMGLEVEGIYPTLGDLRPDLLEVVRSGVFNTKDDKHSSPADRARHFLEFWHDPADASLFGDAQPPDISGQTLQEVCEKWADYHFAREKVEKRTLNSFSDPIFGPEEKHALITFDVMYAHWGYSQRLVLLHDGQTWKLVMVRDHEHWHE
jgi:hypothetical protein